MVLIPNQHVNVAKTVAELNDGIMDSKTRNNSTGATRKSSIWRSVALSILRGSSVLV